MCRCKFSITDKNRSKSPFDGRPSVDPFATSFSNRQTQTFPCAAQHGATFLGLIRTGRDGKFEQGNLREFYASEAVIVLKKLETPSSYFAVPIQFMVEIVATQQICKKLTNTGITDVEATGSAKWHDKLAVPAETGSTIYAQKFCAQYALAILARALRFGTETRHRLSVGRRVGQLRESEQLGGRTTAIARSSQRTEHPTMN